MVQGPMDLLKRQWEGPPSVSSERGIVQYVLGTTYGFPKRLSRPGTTSTPGRDASNQVKRSCSSCRLQPRPRRINVLQHTIRIKPGQGPVRQRPYRVAERLMGPLKTEIRKMIQLGVIKPSDTTFNGLQGCDTTASFVQFEAEAQPNDSSYSSSFSDISHEEDLIPPASVPRAAPPPSGTNSATFIPSFPTARRTRSPDLQRILLEMEIARVDMETEKLWMEKEKLELEKRKLALEIKLLEQKSRPSYTIADDNVFLNL
ncbi:hypothetical protein SKAU_G00387620 [Synaphobranchus kaupii]|uniref:Uncharacterized protein n=1 Tax=Synaphobranchus kaupii TaxID=118154 RepID=A0A9Q1EAY5_SYNKA|nr:hypothetical protein SKAU_G00387620 [Synaphobranchus kaupii]